jgi:trigger factor
LDIQLEKNSNTEALIKINLKESDYQPKYQEKLKSYSKQAQIKGFRPGKVPVSLIEKMYGKSIKVEEINNILVESLKEYIKKNDIKIIGDPLPNNDKAEEIDWDNQKEFDFEYNVGLIDEFEYNLKFKINKYEIKVEDKVLNEAIDELKQRYGKMTNPEVSESGDSIFGSLSQESTEFSKDGLIEIEKVSKETAERIYWS